MNIAIILLAVSVFVFGVGPLLLRTNVILVFLTLCASNLIVSLTSRDVSQLAASTLPVKNYPILSIVEIFILVVLPLVLMLAYKNSTKPAGLVIHILPAVASAILFFMLATTMLPYETKLAIEQSNIYGILKPFFEIVISAGFVFSALYLIITKPRYAKHGKHDK